MPQYAAFLRGINVSGNHRIPMPELRKLFAGLGYTDVSTVLNSGNIRFSTGETDQKEIRSKIEKEIRRMFGEDIPVYTAEMTHLKQILDHAPVWWGTEDKGIYNNIVFILTDETPQEICTRIGDPSVGWEQVMVYDDVIFWSFDLNHYQKCSWWKKTSTAGITEKLTIRTAGTVRKICG